ncbi:hypothetical protein BRC92_11050 [Halobacteriales archaeon QS_4_69_31]|nr:MAG: hypothetical protein BRC92_11050 [Halobacteriales archaeon QS_4_69_31]
MTEGTTLLVRGPAMTRKTDLTVRTLAADDDANTGTVFVTTDDSASALWQRYRTQVPAADPRSVGIVDATGGSAGSGPAGTTSDEYATDGRDPRVATVGSPADLTGVGMAVSKLLEALVAQQELDRVRLGLFSLNTMVIYADDERVAKFLHEITRRIDAIDGFGLVVVHTDGFDERLDSQFGAFVDGTVEVRERDPDGIETRLHGLGEATDWTAVEFDGSDPHPDTPAPAGTNGDSGTYPVPESLHAAIAAAEDERPTLTLCNYDSTDGDGDRLRSYFEVRDISIRTATLDASAPRNVALLHRGNELVAAATVDALTDAVVLESGDAFDWRQQPDVLKALHDDAHGAKGVDKAFLIEVSRVVEMRSYRTGAGRVDAGFQALSNLWGDPRTRRMYDRLVDRGVDVHAYGVPDAPTPADAGVTVHPSEHEEIRDGWFVVHDGAGDDDGKAALVAEERDPGVYHGFWTRTPGRVDSLGTYLRDAYPAR